MVFVLYLSCPFQFPFLFPFIPFPFSLLPSSLLLSLRILNGLPSTFFGLFLPHWVVLLWPATSLSSVFPGTLGHLHSLKTFSPLGLFHLAQRCTFILWTMGIWHPCHLLVAAYLGDPLIVINQPLLQAHSNSCFVFHSWDFTILCFVILVPKTQALINALLLSASVCSWCCYHPNSLTLSWVCLLFAYSALVKFCVLLSFTLPWLCLDYNMLQVFMLFPATFTMKILLSFSSHWI